MTKDGMKVLDSDMHLMEPVDLWERYIDARYKADAPRDSPATTCVTCAWPIQTGAIGVCRPVTIEIPNSIEVTILPKTKESIAPTPNEVGARKFSWKRWTQKASMSLYCIRRAGCKRCPNRAWNPNWPTH